ncbi:MAG: alkaline phosphatase D family protein [Halieaceae bacterium]
MRLFLLLGLLLTCSLASHAATPSVQRPASNLEVSRIAFGSCSFQSVPQPIFQAVVSASPDLYLSLGDAIYGDYDLATKSAYEVTEESLRREWQVLANNPDWQSLVEHVPVMATWDNHDYGHHSAGAEFPLKTTSEMLFLDFFSEPADSDRRNRPGVYESRVFGPEGRRVQVILLDTRSFKSLPVLAQRPEGVTGSLGKYAPNTDPAATLLGRDQWAWLERELKRPAELRLVASSGQIIADEKGMDEWGNYPREREKLLTMIASTVSENVLLLSGNVHFTEVSSLDIGSRQLVDFTSSGLTHVNREYPQYPNQYRVAGPYVEESFGLLEIHWEPDPKVVFKAIGVKGEVQLEYQMAFQKPITPLSHP